MAPRPLARDYEKQEYLTKLTLISIFLGGFGAFISYSPFRRRHQKSLNFKPGDIILLIISTFRLGRMVAYNQVTEPLRAPFARTVPDQTGAGEVTEPKGRGVQRAIGELLTCPICSGTWIAAALVYGLHLFPGPARIFMAIMSTIGAAELLNEVTEFFSWMSQAARKEAGSAS
jgi:hypothetical protein